jgi:hypothetical protein
LNSVGKVKEEAKVSFQLFLCYNQKKVHTLLGAIMSTKESTRRANLEEFIEALARLMPEKREILEEFFEITKNLTPEQSERIIRLVRGDLGNFAVEDTDTAKTDLGRQLLEARAEILASGIPLLDRDALELEIANRRGGQS